MRRLEATALVSAQTGLVDIPRELADGEDVSHRTPERHYGRSILHVARSTLEA